jgi:hypothetical protein
MLKSMQVLETESSKSFCFLNQNTFLLEDFKSKDFETHFCFENKELLSPFFENNSSLKMISNHFSFER